MASSSNVYNPQVRVDHAAELAETIAPLSAHAFPIHTWTPNNLSQQNIIIARFNAVVKVFTRIEDIEIRKQIILDGIGSRRLVNGPDMTPKLFFKFCNWLRSEEGSVLITRLQKNRALKRATGTLTAADVALVSAFNYQETELSRRRKEFRADIVAELAAARLVVANIERRREEGLDEIAVEYFPASSYDDIEEDAFIDECVKLYEADRIARGQEAMAKDDDFFYMCRRTFGDQVKQQHIAKFLTAESRGDDLRAWVEDRILLLDQQGERRMVNTFRHLMEASGGELAPPVREAAEARSLVRTNQRAVSRARRPEVDPSLILAFRTRFGGRNVHPRVEGGTLGVGGSGTQDVGAAPAGDQSAPAGPTPA